MGFKTVPNPHMPGKLQLLSEENYSTTEKTKLESIVNYMLFKGSIAIASDFPTLALVQAGWTYKVIANVIDNNVAKTNTGLSFLSGEDIAWDGTTWTKLGISTIDWSNIDNKPSSSVTNIDDAVSKKHTQNTDLYLDTSISTVLYVDGNRTDIYTANGSITKPFKTIMAAINSVTDASANKRYAIDIVGGKTYSEQVILKAYVGLRSPEVARIQNPGGVGHTIVASSMSAVSRLQNLVIINNSSDIEDAAMFLGSGGNVGTTNCSLTGETGYGLKMTAGAFIADVCIFRGVANSVKVSGGNCITNFCTFDATTFDVNVTGGTFKYLAPYFKGNGITGVGTRLQKADSILNDSSVIGTSVKNALETLDTGKSSVISVNTTLTVKASGGDFTTIQAALDSLKSKRINSDVTVTISVDPGLFTHTATILFRHPQGNRINIVGAAPVTTTLTSLVSFIGTTGNYSVTLNVANTAGMAIGDYCIIRGSTGTGEYRAVMGCWEITNIPSGTQIVVKNTYRKTVAPTLTITGGSLDCLKTILKFNGCDGLYPGNSTGYIYNLAIVGNGTANTDGINISQRGYNFGNHVIYLGESGASYSLGINGFGRYGIANTSNAQVWVISVVVSNCGNYGLYAYNQAQFAGSGIISSGNGNIGIYATDGAWITAVSSFAIGNSTVGFYANSRAGINAQYSEAIGNVYSGFQANFGSSIDARSTKALNNGYHGYSSGSNSIIYATSSSAVGNGAAINYYGYYAWNDGTIIADSSTGSGNFSGDFRAEDRSFIKVTSYTGSPTFSPAVDTMGNGGAIIRSVVATSIKIADTIKNTPAGNIAATDVQAALNELDTEKLAKDSEVAIKLYSQNAEPTLTADNNLAIWIDTDDSNRVYLLYRRGTGDQVAVELA
jgi:hypothetical protein